MSCKKKKNNSKYDKLLLEQKYIYIFYNYSILYEELLNVFEIYTKILNINTYFVNR